MLPDTLGFLDNRYFPPMPAVIGIDIQTAPAKKPAHRRRTRVALASL
jgi:hypothetical protein